MIRSLIILLALGMNQQVFAQNTEDQVNDLQVP